MHAQKTDRPNRILAALAVAWIAISLAIGSTAMAGAPDATNPTNIATGR